jgi:hypothetical protein
MKLVGCVRGRRRLPLERDDARSTACSALSWTRLFLNRCGSPVKTSACSEEAGRDAWVSPLSWRHLLREAPADWVLSSGDEVAGRTEACLHHEGLDLKQNIGQMTDVLLARLCCTQRKVMLCLQPTLWVGIGGRHLAQARLHGGNRAPGGVAGFRSGGPAGVRLSAGRRFLRAGGPWASRAASHRR